MEVPPGEVARGSVIRSVSHGSEFERADVSGTDLGTAIGINCQGFSGPAAEVFNFIRLHLRKRPDAAQCTDNVVSAKGSLRVFKRLEQGGLDGTFDLGT